MKKSNKNLLTTILLTLLVLASCTNNNTTPGSKGFINDDGFTRADSIVNEIGDSRNFQRTLDVIDSLDQKGELSLVKTIFYRTISYNLLGQYSTSLRLYAQLAGIDVKKLKTQTELECYIYSYNNYVRVLCEMRRYDRALREANAVDRKLRAAGYDGFTDHHDIAQIIGECQLHLGQEELAAQSFQKSLQGVHARLAQYQDPLDYRECQKTMNAIVMAYAHDRHYDRIAPWIAVQDSLYVLAEALPQRDTVFLDEMKADISYSKARLAVSQGRSEEAERAFNEYLSTHQAKQLSSIINSTRYLILAGRYEEAAHNYEQLDKFLLESGYKADFENFGRYMIPKFRANQLAGRRDSALRVANIIAEYFDSAQVRQRRIDSDLLTTFYDTEGKERQIAEQRAEISQQRLWTVVIGAVIFAVFMAIYLMQRRRAFKELNEKNRELMLANERAEESSRMKTQFIHQISHEVRTPLNVLSGFSQVLATPDITISSDELQDISQKIVENSNRITTLVDKMLDLSMVNSNAAIECRDTICPADLAKLAVDKSGIQQIAYLDFLLQVSPEAETLSISTNQESAMKALMLLLDNAIKFTHPQAFRRQQIERTHASVTMSVSTTQQEVFFVVEDTGIGIAPEHAEKIFDEFLQLDDYADGTGIGLSIARTLARHMNGDIVLDTTYTNGARFIMSLPR